MSAGYAIALAWLGHVHKNNVPTMDSWSRVQSGSATISSGNFPQLQMVDDLLAPTNSVRMGWKYVGGRGTDEIEFIVGDASFATVPNC
jgi:hypothetical protein